MYFFAESSEVINELLSSGTIIPVLAIVLGCTIAIVAIISGTASKVAVTKAREKSRRELAAYVAEGTMAPDDAVALMNAGKTGCNITVTDSLKV